MSRALAAALLLVSGSDCGGEAFTEGWPAPAADALVSPQEVPDGVSGGIEASFGKEASAQEPDAGGGSSDTSTVEAARKDVRAAEGPDAGSAGEAAAPAAEAGAPDGPAEASPSGCTPLDGGSYACSNAGTVRVPADVCVVRPTTVGNLVIPTPGACQCAETYTCACLARYGVSCGPSGGDSCIDSPGFGPVWNCP